MWTGASPSGKCAIARIIDEAIEGESAKCAVGNRRAREKATVVTATESGRGSVKTQSRERKEDELNGHSIQNRER